MQIKYKIKLTQVVFSKWSRKGFAVFASLSKLVKIAHLRIEICLQAIRKNIDVIKDSLCIFKTFLNYFTSIEFCTHSKALMLSKNQENKVCSALYVEPNVYEIRKIKSVNYQCNSRIFC